ncbi:MAG: molybdopterin-dependent oxidoreductase [Chloroflexi bacterium]|nr:molybdopterin-dependent oxidoreductase [Chloroflexota bacterium]MCI0846873.1 molybdopterin-dependent oxidoreductase [Chloroflexota bacterium]
MGTNMIRKAMITVGGSRTALRAMYYPWRVMPYPIRRGATALFITLVLAAKRLFRVDGQNELTPATLMGSLSFWGVPEIDLNQYSLTIDGAVAQARTLSIDQLRAQPSCSRLVRMDCVGGFRNNSIMDGVLLRQLLQESGVEPGARRAVFHCADGYRVALDLEDLLGKEAFLAYSFNGEETARFGFPLRLAIPGKYGYQWAKWVTRIELVAREPKGYWGNLGLPDRADIGDRW